VVYLFVQIKSMSPMWCTFLVRPEQLSDQAFQDTSFPEDRSQTLLIVCCCLFCVRDPGHLC